MTMTSTMRTGWKALAVGVVCGAMVSPATLAAKTKLPVPSTWELDLLRSDFGGGPKMQSDVFTVNEDKPAMLSLDFVVTDDAGRTVKSSWSGPQNGKMLPLTGESGRELWDRQGRERALDVCGWGDASGEDVAGEE